MTPIKFKRTIHDVIRATSELTGLQPYTLRESKSRRRNEVFEARIAIMIVSREHLHKSYHAIGVSMRRDHTTIMLLLDRYGGDHEIRSLARQITEYLERPTLIERYAERQRAICHA